MKSDKIMDAIGMIDEELIAEAQTEVIKRKRISKKVIISLVAALIILFALGITAVAKGWFDNKIINLNIINGFSDENQKIYSYILEFDTEISDNAKETINEYYLPLILINENYNASANSYAGHFYWENKNTNQIIGFIQYSALTFDEYSLSYSEKMKVTEEVFLYKGDEIKSIVFTSEENENRAIKHIYWSDGYYIFNIMAINCDDEFIKQVIESMEKVENFSDYGNFRENKYH